jgi:CRISPR/Cas system-associated exonuclease Cas4 (RecB family)
MHWTLAHDRIPAHTDHRERCRGCSLIDVCLPVETEKLKQTT